MSEKTTTSAVQLFCNADQSTDEDFLEVLRFIHDVTLHLQVQSGERNDTHMFHRAHRLYVKWNCDANRGDKRYTKQGPAA